MICKIIANGNLLYSLGDSNRALYQPRGMGWGGRWEGVSEGRDYVYLWLIYVEVLQKTTKFYKAIILQKKKKQIIELYIENNSQRIQPLREEKKTSKCVWELHHKRLLAWTQKRKWGRSQDGRVIWQGDHFLLHKFIKRSFECWATSTKQFLNAGRRHQAPRKSAHSLQKEVVQNIKDKKRDKQLGTETHPGEGVIKEEVSKQQEAFSSAGLWGIWNCRGQHNWEKFLKISK